MSSALERTPRISPPLSAKSPFSLLNRLPNFSLLTRPISKAWAAVRKTEVRTIVAEAAGFIANPGRQQLFGRAEMQVEIKRRGRAQREAVTVRRSRRIAAKGLLTSSQGGIGLRLIGNS